MATSKKTGYVPRKVAQVIKKRAMPRKEDKEKKTKEEERKRKTKATEKVWRGARIPADIRRPWEVFQDDVSDRWELSGGLRDRRQFALEEDLRAVQKLGALRAFQALPACRKRTYTDISLQEVSAFVAWSATCGLADAKERAAAWAGLDEDHKHDHVPHNWRALLEKDPTWHVLIEDDMKDEVEERHEQEDGDEEVAAEDGDVSSSDGGVCAAGTVVQRKGHDVVATRIEGSRESVPGAKDGNNKLHGPARRRPASPVFNHAISGVSPPAGTSAKDEAAKKKAKAKAKPKSKQKAKAEKEVAEEKAKTKDPRSQYDEMGRPRMQRRAAALDAKYPWGQEGGPPPANEKERRSLLKQIARLRREWQNFGRPERADGERRARAEALLHIMRGKACVSFG